MIKYWVLVVSAMITASPSLAVVVGGEILRQNDTGEFVKLDTAIPFDVGADNFDTPNLYAFDEDQNILLEDAIAVDLANIDGLIPAQTVVASHYVFFDSLSGIHHGFVDFDAPILGIASQQETMAATDFLANTNVNYIGTELRGLENGDHVWVDARDPHRLWVYWAGSSPGDYIRVFTAKSEAALFM